MAHSYSFAVVQFSAHPLRDERLNVGLAVFERETLDVRVCRKLEKLRAISSALDTNLVRAALDSLPAIDADIMSSGVRDPVDRAKLLGDFSVLKFSTLGSFVAESQAAYELAISRLIETLIAPEVGAARVIVKRTRLLNSFKSLLKSERILARKGEGLSDHRVVSNGKRGKFPGGLGVRHSDEGWQAGYGRRTRNGEAVAEVTIE